MIAAKLEYNKNLFGFTDPDDHHFFRMYLSYLSQLKFDDIAHWSKEDVDFNNERSFTTMNY